MTDASPHLTSPQPLQLCSFLQLWLPPSLSPLGSGGILHAGFENQSDNVAFTRSGLRGGNVGNLCFQPVSKPCTRLCVSAVGGRGPGWRFFMATLNLCFLPSSFCCPLTLASAPLLPLFLPLSTVFKLSFQTGSLKKMVGGIVFGGRMTVCP